MTERFDPVQRFDQGGSTLGEMARKDDGDYVRFEDYDRLQKQLAEVTAQRDSFLAKAPRAVGRAQSHARRCRERKSGNVGGD